VKKPATGDCPLHDTPTASPPARAAAGDEQQAAIVRSDLNLEKWPVYVPSDSRHKPHARIFERETTLADGRRVAASVKVGFTDLGMLITDDQKVFCALLKLWEEDGRPTVVSFSLRRLADALKRQWNGKLARSLTDSLLRLRSTPFVWTNAYEDATSGELLRLLKTFTILDDLEVAEKAIRGHTTGQSCRAQFHPLIDANIRHNFSKPILYDTIIGFESGVAQLLYRHLDIVMWSKDRYVCRTRKLFEEIGLEGDEYRYVSRRRRTLERAFRELDGAPITSGFIRATLTPTKDGKDLNAVFTKTAAPSHPPELLPAAEEAADAVQAVAPSRHAADEGSVAVVRHFYRVFHAHEVEEFNPRELEQAAALVARHGLEVALHTVDLARAETRRDYRVQVFGFVLTFADRAKADLARARTRLEPETIPHCALCGGAGSIVMTRASGGEIVVGCPHDASTVRTWERERGLRYHGMVES
jgi:hypothetical protein